MYECLVKSTITTRKWACDTTMQALSIAINRPIWSLTSTPFSTIKTNLSLSSSSPVIITFENNHWSGSLKVSDQQFCMEPITDIDKDIAPIIDISMTDNLFI